MELALARIEMLYIEKDSIHWEMFKNDCMEKEKKQIIDAYSIGFLVSKDLDMIKPSFNIAEDYYNQAYNQNK